MSTLAMSFNPLNNLHYYLDTVDVLAGENCGGSLSDTRVVIKHSFTNQAIAVEDRFWKNIPFSIRLRRSNCASSLVPVWNPPKLLRKLPDHYSFITLR
ncbi:unnamed protein product [Dicrocoelium dendriticum]|nr:unnamed protein product [Dicrocoelium dendriticum]